jgi:hypothetical protein
MLPLSCAAVLYLFFFILEAWEKSAVGKYNLGSDCLTSKKSKAACREYLRNNPDFRKEIEDKIGDVLELDEGPTTGSCNRGSSCGHDG